MNTAVPIVLVVLIVFCIFMAIVTTKAKQSRPPVAQVPVTERRAQLLRQAAGGPFKQMVIRIKGDRVVTALGRDLGALRGARAELIRGKPAPRHSVAYDVVIGFQSGPGKSVILITFADGTYVERTVNFGMVINERRTLAEAAAEVARFNALAALEAS